MMGKISISFEINDDEVLESTSEGNQRVKDLVVSALDSYKVQASESDLKVIDKLFNDCYNKEGSGEIIMRELLVCQYSDTPRKTHHFI
jgi:hypothetical protein